MNLHAFVGSCPPGFAVDPARCRKCRAPMRSDGAACTSGTPHPATPRSIVNYATWTGTRRNLAEMHRYGMRIITGPDQLDRTKGIPPLAWALDNGAWGCHQRGEGFNAGGFRRALERWGEGADWVVLPDIVGGGLASLDMSREWRDEVSAAGRPVLLAVQDGMEPHHIRDELGPNVGIFVGGTTDWKERTISTWGTLARAVGCYLHIGRVNTIRRTQLAVDAGADSIDGTTVSKYAVTAEKMARACRTEPRPELPFGVTT